MYFTHVSAHPFGYKPLESLSVYEKGVHGRSSSEQLSFFKNFVQRLHHLLQPWIVPESKSHHIEPLLRELLQELFTTLLLLVDMQCRAHDCVQTITLGGIMSVPPNATQAQCPGPLSASRVALAADSFLGSHPYAQNSERWGKGGKW